MTIAPLTVLHIEPQSWWREIVATSLSRWPEYKLVASAATGEDGLGLALQIAPQVVIFDPLLPDIDGATLAAALQGLPTPPKLVLLADGLDETVQSWIQPFGVAGFVAKNTRVPDLLPAAMGEIRRGRTFLPAGAGAAQGTNSVESN